MIGLLDEDGRNYKWSVVWMIWCISLFNYADPQAISSVFPLREKEMGLSSVHLGLLGSAFAWVCGLGAPLAGMIVDRVARTKAILFGLHAWSAICVANGLSRNFTVPVSSGRGFRRNGCITRVVADFARLRIPGGRMMVQAIAASAFRGLFEGLCDANIWTSFRCRATEGARTGRQSDETWSSGWVAALRPG